MKIIYSFNKQGYEADYWARELSAASDERHTFIPFNHDPYLPIARYLRAQLLDTRGNHGLSERHLVEASSSASWRMARSRCTQSVDTTNSATSEANHMAPT